MRGVNLARYAVLVALVAALAGCPAKPAEPGGMPGGMPAPVPTVEVTGSYPPPPGADWGN